MVQKFDHDIGFCEKRQFALPKIVIISLAPGCVKKSNLSLKSK
jgi:hypothetical protein